MVERLSSLQTFFCKFFMAPIWIGAVGLAVMKAMRGPDVKSWLPIFLMSIFGSAYICWSCLPLKAVSIDDQSLYISNYFREIVVPFSCIGDVTENRWMNNRPITIHFKLQTEFGDHIIFMPPFRFIPTLSPDPVIARLKELAKIS